jgi:putative FmdB family regulatory protein
MPTYRYECVKCAKIHEDFHSIADPPLSRCPSCGGRLERLISGGGGVILKGSGFHNTDYRSKSWKSAESRDAAGSAPAAPAKADAPSPGSPPPKADAPAKSEGASKPESSGKSESSGKPESAPKSKRKD